jgi:hypothetical protein
VRWAIAVIPRRRLRKEIEIVAENLRWAYGSKAIQRINVLGCLPGWG